MHEKNGDEKATRILHELLLTMGCFVLLVMVFSPSFGAYLIWAQNHEMSQFIEVRRGASVLLQMEDPGMEIADTMHGVIQWRLLFPLIGHFLHLSPLVFFSLAHLGCFLLLFYLIHFLRSEGFSYLHAGLTAVILGSSSWFFTSISWLGYFDSWLALGLVASVVARNPHALWAACLMTPWIDERFVIAAPLALFCRYLLHSTVTGVSKMDIKGEVLVPAGILFLFVIVRLGVLAGYSSLTATLDGYLATQNNLSAPFYNIALGLWDGLRISWGLVMLAIVMTRRRRWAAIVLAFSTLVVISAALYTAKDFSRSMTMVLPVVIVGTVYLKRLSLQRLRQTLAIGGLLALVIPAHHVMDDRIIPVLTIYKELYYIKTVAPSYLKR